MRPPLHHYSLPPLTCTSEDDGHNQIDHNYTPVNGSLAQLFGGAAPSPKQVLPGHSLLASSRSSPLEVSQAGSSRDTAVHGPVDQYIVMAYLVMARDPLTVKAYWLWPGTH